jgi:hypothetical protein
MTAPTLTQAQQQEAVELLRAIERNTPKTDPSKDSPRWLIVYAWDAWIIGEKTRRLLAAIESEAKE